MGAEACAHLGILDSRREKGSAIVQMNYIMSIPKRIAIV